MFDEIFVFEENFAIKWTTWKFSRNFPKMISRILSKTRKYYKLRIEEN